ncbi:MAG: GNAT family N-acetyltransferase [Gemmatimonadetes bacterium]|nr:GNAT family N-acetyltransferase [Gemmatimonadota bacterium]
MKPAPSPASDPSSDPRTTEDPPDGLSIRPVQSLRELQAAVRIQKDTWGQEFSDVVPSSMMQITAKMGGVVAGAFDSEGDLAGLVYGITGLRDGRLAHWSHMLAVRPEFRNRGVGQALKHYQKARLLEEGVSVMYWTFDPLVSRNAHLNLNRLGAEVDEYVADMYGESDSELHRLGTDRFIVRWTLDTPHVETGPPELAAGVPELLATDPPSSTLPDAESVAVGVPDDVEELEAESFEGALAWRISTRAAFAHYLGRGYRVTGFVPGRPHGLYVLSNSTGSPS